MKLTIENINNLAIASLRSDTKCMDYNIHPDMYEFIVKHRNFKGEFRYQLLRDCGDNNQNKRYVGTFIHPYGSYRYDCYEMDLLDKQSFLDFLDTVIRQWYVKYNQ
jgi:hypothetical protein